MKEVIERCNWLVNKCNDKAITPDVKDDFRYLLEEIERLNNIINELEKWIKKGIFDLDGDYDYEGIVSGYENVLDKLEELKGSGKE